jgi:hypothetical protein
MGAITRWAGTPSAAASEGARGASAATTRRIWEGSRRATCARAIVES